MSDSFVLAVCGGRNFDDKARVFSVLDRVNRKRKITTLIQGMCPTGADMLAAAWAKERGIQCFGFLANWREFGKSAGPRRNKQMIDYGLHGVIAFPGGVGTADMVRQSKEAGLIVMEVLP